MGKFSQLDEFISYMGIERTSILARQSGTIPVSGVGSLVRHNVALIRDAGSMVNPVSLGGLAPIVYAAKLLAENINNLGKYEESIKNHPMANSALSKARVALLSIPDNERLHFENLLQRLCKEKNLFLRLCVVIINPWSLLRLRKLFLIYEASNICYRYGW